MSKKIDLSKPLSAEDEQYLRDRGRLADIARANGEDPTSAGGPATGGVSGVSVGGAGLGSADNTAGAASVRAAAQREQQQADNADPDSPEAKIAAGEYDAKGVTKDHLLAEINKRNEGREEADQIPTDGKKDDLIAALEADDDTDE